MTTKTLVYMQAVLLGRCEIKPMVTSSEDHDGGGGGGGGSRVLV